MKTGWFIGVLVFIVFTGGLVQHQISSRVIGEAAIAAGGPSIVVREIQLRPFSLKGLLRVNPLVYRLEYYQRENEPLLSAQTFLEESYVSKSVQIEWISSDVATVTFDQTIAFKCVEGWWQKIDLNATGCSGNSLTRNAEAPFQSVPPSMINAATVAALQSTPAKSTVPPQSSLW